MNEAAIRRQIEVLELVERMQKPFDISIVVDHNRSCGTTACALGWMAILGDWPGLKPSAYCPGGAVEYNGQIALFDAFEGVFGINAGTAYFIFMPQAEDWGMSPEEIQPKHVIHRLRMLLETGEERFLVEMHRQQAEGFEWPETEGAAQ